LQVVAASLFLLLGKDLPQSGTGAPTGIIDDYTVGVVSSSFKLNTEIIRMGDITATRKMRKGECGSSPILQESLHSYYIKIMTYLEIATCPY
jgi:hypothetical protein